jgi:hypothetical protein
VNFAAMAVRDDQTSLSPCALVLAAAVPLLFLHVYYQPSVTVHALGTDLSGYLSDFAILAVALAALFDARRRGFDPLRRTPPAVWILAGLFIAVVAGSTLWGGLVDDRYATGAHFVTAVKFGWYAVLAPATVLLVRTRRELAVVAGAAIAWSAALTLVGVLQYEGHADVFGGPNPHTREPSWLGIADFGAYSAAVLSLALVALALAPPGAGVAVSTAAAAVAGGLGTILAAPLAPLIGVVAAAVLLLAVALRRRVVTVPAFLAGAALLTAVGVAALEIRSPDIQHFQDFRSQQPAPSETSQHVQTYAQRTILTYVGVRIFLDHPLVGVGWQGSTEGYNAVPYIDDARRRYPNQPDFALPTEDHPWGVQDAYVQALADMGLLGGVLLVGAILAGVVVGARAARRGEPGDLAGAIGASWLLVAGAELAAYGLYAGVPIDALLWLGLGLAAAGAAASREAASVPSRA